MWWLLTRPLRVVAYGNALAFKSIRERANAKRTLYLERREAGTPSSRLSRLQGHVIDTPVSAHPPQGASIEDTPWCLHRSFFRALKSMSLNRRMDDCFPQRTRNRTCQRSSITM